MNTTTDHGPRTTGQIDPELTHLARFFAWLGLPAPHVSGPVLVRVVYRTLDGYNCFTLEPANAAARELLGATGNGHFATPADARRRARWNCWEIVEETMVQGFSGATVQRFPTPSP